MSSTAVINIRTDAKIKAKAQAVAEKLGLNLSVVVNAYLRQLVRTESVFFSLDEKPTDYLLKAIKESKKDINKGFVSPDFDNVKDGDKWLDNPKAKYENQIQ